MLKDTLLRVALVAILALIASISLVQAQFMNNPDLDANGRVDTVDIVLFKQVFDHSGNNAADFNVNGTVDIYDFTYLVAHFGQDMNTITPEPTQPDNEPSITITPTEFDEPPTPTATSIPEPSPTQTPPISSALINGDFEQVIGGVASFAPWNIAPKIGTTFSLVNPGYESSNALHVRLTSTAENTQLLQRNISLQPNQRYVLSFVAKTNKQQRVVAHLHDDKQTTVKYGLSGQVFSLSTDWQLYAHEFVTPAFTTPVTNARLRINLGDVYGKDVELWFDDIMLSPVE